MGAYGDDQNFIAWLAAQGLLLPEGADPTALRHIGSMYLDSAYEWRLQCSRRTGGLTQDLAWGRTGARVQGQDIPPDYVPPSWVYASYRAAYLSAVTPGWATSGTDPNRLTRREQVDVISREFFAAADVPGSSDIAPGMPFDALINSMVLPWLCPKGRSMNSLFRVI